MQIGHAKEIQSILRQKLKAKGIKNPVSFKHDEYLGEIYNNIELKNRDDGSRLFSILSTPQQFTRIINLAYMSSLFYIGGKEEKGFIACQSNFEMNGYVEHEVYFSPIKD